VLTRYTAAPISAEHKLEDFNCGNLVLNSWLRNNALRASRQGTAQTTVLTEEGDLKVVGYYALSPTEVNRSELPSKAAGGNSTVPGYLLAKLALDQTVQGQGLGADLLGKALEKIVTAAGLVAGRVVVVDAIDDSALQFYIRHGFRQIPGSMRSFRLISEVRDSQTLSPAHSLQ